jgi:hypothetical protein
MFGGGNVNASEGASSADSSEILYSSESPNDDPNMLCDETSGREYTRDNCLGGSILTNSGKADDDA